MSEDGGQRYNEKSDGDVGEGLIDRLFFKEALDALEEAVGIIDADYRYGFVNKAGLCRFESAREAIVGKSLARIYGNDYFETTLRPLIDRCFRGETVRYHSRVTVASGEGQWVEVRYHPLFARDGSVSHVLSVCPQRPRERMSGAESCGFLATMSHEIRTPLNGIIGMAEYLDHQEWDEETRRCLDVINHSGAFLLELINDILDLSKIEAGRLEIRPRTVPLAEEMKALQTILEQRASLKGLKVETEIDLFRKLYRLDWRRVQQVLLNLFSNAVKFTSPPGTICIRLKEQSTGHLFFEVADSGTGIPESDREKIFEPFEQGSEGFQGKSGKGHGGTGLGLAICKSLVERMNGSIELSSIVGEGTSVRFFLEAVPGAVETASPEEEEKSSDAVTSSRQEGHALILENRESDAFVLSRMLKIDGIGSTMVTDPSEAERAVREMSFCCIFIGIPLASEPLLGWAEERLFPLLGRHGPAVFAYTTQVGPEMRNRCRALGFRGVLEKPLQRQLLQNLLRKCGGEDSLRS